MPQSHSSRAANHPTSVQSLPGTDRIGACGRVVGWEYADCSQVRIGSYALTPPQRKCGEVLIDRLEDLGFLTGVPHGLYPWLGSVIGGRVAPRAPGAADITLIIMIRDK
jgi:hypothetical protein